MDAPSKKNYYLAEHAQLLITSYEHLTGRRLLSSTTDDIAVQAKALFHAPFVVVSHNTDPDPIFNYANQTALTLFEMTWEEFVKLPSRFSSEPVGREERARWLKQSETYGFVDNYSGVRISKSKKRFMIEQATIWNLKDAQGVFCGQAATFGLWRHLS